MKKIKLEITLTSLDNDTDAKALVDSVEALLNEKTPGDAEVNDWSEEVEEE